jgi:hypothetical protein
MFCLPVSSLKTLRLQLYQTIILPVVLYGCETWSLTLSEERRRGVIENRVLRRIFGCKREEGAGGCIHLAQDVDQWRALVNTVMDLRVL